MGMSCSQILLMEKAAERKTCVSPNAICFVKSWDWFSLEQSYKGSCWPVYQIKRFLHHLPRVQSWLGSFRKCLSKLLTKFCSFQALKCNTLRSWTSFVIDANCNYIFNLQNAVHTNLIYASLLLSLVGQFLPSFPLKCTAFKSSQFSFM